MLFVALVALVALVAFATHVAGVLFEQKRLSMSGPKMAKSAERKE